MRFLAVFLSAVFARVEGVAAGLSRVSDFYVAGALNGFSFVVSDLLVYIVFTSLTLLAFHEQVVGRCHLIMLVVEDESRRLLEVLTTEMCLQLLAYLSDDWDLVFANDYSLQLHGLDLSVPFVLPQISH